MLLKNVGASAADGLNVKTQDQRCFLSIHLAAVAYNCVSTLKGPGPVDLENNIKSEDHIYMDKDEERGTPTLIPQLFQTPLLVQYCSQVI